MKYDNILTVRATKEQVRLFEEGEGTIYDMEFWGAEMVGTNVWQVSFDSDVPFDQSATVHLRTIAQRLYKAA